MTNENYTIVVFNGFVITRRCSTKVIDLTVTKNNSPRRIPISNSLCKFFKNLNKENTSKNEFVFVNKIQMIDTKTSIKGLKMHYQEQILKTLDFMI